MNENTQEFNSIPSAAVQCRWPLRDGALPLAHRHITALTQRGAGASLYAYVQSRVEQLLSGEFPLKHPNGMVVVGIDPSGEILITIEARPAAPAPEDFALKVSPAGVVIDGGDASVWVRSGDTVITPPLPAAIARGTRSLVSDLARTLAYRVVEEPISSEVMEASDEAFLVSDLFGVRALDGRNGTFAQTVADGYAKLVG